MRIGFIGAGNVTKTFGRHLMNAGHEIIVSNLRGPETLAGLVAELGPGATAGTKAHWLLWMVAAYAGTKVVEFAEAVVDRTAVETCGQFAFFRT